jgi:hypothetical protein
MLRGDFGSLLTSETVPAMFPLPVGAKITGNRILLPGLNLTGTVKLPIENPLPVTESEVI